MFLTARRIDGGWHVTLNCDGAERRETVFSATAQGLELADVVREVVEPKMRDGKFVPCLEVFTARQAKRSVASMAKAPLVAGVALAAVGLAVGAGVGLTTKDTPSEAIPPTERVNNVQLDPGAVKQPGFDTLHQGYSGPMTLVAQGATCPGFVSPFTEMATLGFDGAKLNTTFQGGSTTMGTIKPNGEFVTSDAADTSSGTLVPGATQRFRVLFTLGGQKCPYDATLKLTTPIALVAAGPPPAFALGPVDLGASGAASGDSSRWLAGGLGLGLVALGGAVVARRDRGGYDTSDIDRMSADELRARIAYLDEEVEAASPDSNGRGPGGFHFPFAIMTILSNLAGRSVEDLEEERSQAQMRLSELPKTTFNPDDDPTASDRTEIG